jgi:hypothetical protein
MLSILFAINKVNHKRNLKVLSKVLHILSAILLIGLGLMLIYIFIYVFFYTFVLSYNFIYLIANLIANESVAIYLSLTGTLIVGAYFPERIGYAIIYIIAKLTRNKDGFERIYTTFARSIRSKMFIYFFACAITIISSIESLGGEVIIHIPIWNDFKPFIYQSVVSFIAFDGFLILLQSERKGILTDIKSLIRFIQDGYNKVTQKKDISN